MNRRMLPAVVAGCLMFGGPLATAVPSLAEAIRFVAPGRAVAQVPTYEDVVGRPFGERLTEHHEMVTYLRAVAEASPRVSVVSQGTSWEGRELMLAVVTSPENHARLEEIRRASLRLDDPRTASAEEAGSLIETQPVIAWFGGSIHGNESSGAEGALMLLEHLSTRDDAATLEALDDVIVLIDPVLNPDGRDAWAQFNHRRVGRDPSPETDDWSNDATGWEGTGFRTG
ncbi:MAG: M14 family zinc carboxypeptidase, partial [Gemmatimonadota bacterium]|nr:M14 family zinc carboxypeptidase [Gemmatimonadota bacterium]